MTPIQSEATMQDEIERRLDKIDEKLIQIDEKLIHLDVVLEKKHFTNVMLFIALGVALYPWIGLGWM